MNDKEGSASVSEKAREMHVWIVNQYAAGANEAGCTRHAGLAKELKKNGFHTLIVSSPRSYMSGAPTELASKQQGGKRTSRFLWLKAPSYSGNGLGRIVNMAVFALKSLVVPAIRVWRGRLVRPSIIVGVTPSMFAATSALLLAKIVRCPFVLEVSDLYPKTITSLGHASPRHPYIRLLSFLERLLYRRADFILSPLQRMGDHVERTIGQRRPGAWVPNHVDLDLSEVPTPVNMNSQPFKIIYTGTHGLANSLETLLQAAQLLNDADVVIELFGDGVAKAGLQQQSKEMGLTNVTFKDPVRKHVIPLVLENADGLVLPVIDSPLYDDGLSPNKLYDYLAAGRPTIIATNSPHNPVSENCAGLTVAPEDPEALAEGIRLLMDTSLEERAAMGVRGRKVVETVYNLSVVTRTYVECFRKLSVRND